MIRERYYGLSSISFLWSDEPLPPPPPPVASLYGQYLRCITHSARMYSFPRECVIPTEMRNPGENRTDLRISYCSFYQKLKKRDIFRKIDSRGNRASSDLRISPPDISNPTSSPPKMLPFLFAISRSKERHDFGARNKAANITVTTGSI